MRLVALILLIVVSLSGLSNAKTGLDRIDNKGSGQDKPIEPFLKKKEVWSPTPSPFVPGAQQAGTSKKYKSERYYIGLEPGATITRQFGGRNFAVAGSYPDGLRNAELSSYSIGIGWMANAILDIPINRDLGIQAKGGYRQHKARATGVSPAGNVRGNDPRFENDVNFTWDYFGADALFRVQLSTDGLYALGGIGYSSLLKSFVVGTQTSEDGLGNRQQMTFQGELPGFYSSSKFDAKFGFGTWLPLGDNGIAIAPELVIGIPLTSLHAQQTVDDYKAIDREVNNIVYATLGFAFKFPFGSNSNDDRIASSIPSSNSSTSSMGLATEPGKMLLSGRVVDNFNRHIYDALVTVIDLASNKKIASEQTTDGNYSVNVGGPGRYSVTADAPGYLFGSALFEIDKDGHILKNSIDIKLSPSANGRVRLLVFFDFDQSVLQSSSYPELDRAVELMEADPSMQVEIAGFTDAQGTDAYNQDLSQRRANAVREYLVRQGIEDTRLTAIGYGEANPVASNETEDGRAENRRVEFVVRKR